MPDFSIPPEAVEALERIAAQAVLDHRIPPEVFKRNGLPPGEPDYADREKGRAVLNALLDPLLSAYRDHLAAQAGEPPFDREWMVEGRFKDSLASERMAWSEGAAAGVAASEKRVRELREALMDSYTFIQTVARASDPGSENASDENWRMAYEFASDEARNRLPALAALLSEDPKGE